jgi:cell shape-determining protein MreC
VTNFVKIENTEFVRDMSTQAVLNTDRQGLQQFQNTRKRLLAQKNEQQDTRTRLQKLEEDMQEIKQLLQVIAMRGTNGN